MSLRFRVFCALLLSGSLACVFAQGPLTLAWSGYLLGFRSDMAQAVAVDKDGNIWVAGSSSSPFDSPTPDTALQVSQNGGADVFLAKYVQGGKSAALLHWTWLGGTGDEDVRAMAIDSRGRIVVTGATTSTDFPTAGNPFQSTNGGGGDTYVAIIDPSRSGQDALVFSSYYGGTGADVPTALTVDPSGAVIVVGYTTSGDLPNVENNVQGGNRGGWDAFLIRVDPNAAGTLTYATYFGGDSTDIATGVAVDRNGIIWFTGYTASDDFPLTPNAYRSQLTPPADGFLVGLDLTQPAQNAHYYGSYFGGSDWDAPQKLLIDASGALWIAGYTFSPDLPGTAGGAQKGLAGLCDAFVMRLDMKQPPDQIITYATYFGGKDAEVLYGFTLLDDGRVAIAGYTTSDDFPTAGDPIQNRRKSAFADAFVARINTRTEGAEAIEYSTYIGGTYTDVATGVAADAAGNLYLSGYTNSSDIPVTDSSARQNPAPLPSAFVVKLAR